MRREKRRERDRGAAGSRILGDAGPGSEEACEYLIPVSRIDEYAERFRHHDHVWFEARDLVERREAADQVLLRNHHATRVYGTLNSAPSEETGHVVRSYDPARHWCIDPDHIALSPNAHFPDATPELRWKTSEMVEYPRRSDQWMTCKRQLIDRGEDPHERHTVGLGFDERRL